MTLGCSDMDETVVSSTDGSKARECGCLRELFSVRLTGTGLSTWLSLLNLSLLASVTRQVLSSVPFYDNNTGRAAGQNDWCWKTISCVFHLCHLEVGHSHAAISTTCLVAMATQPAQHTGCVGSTLASG